ncbi:AAA family ATPase [Anaerospora hongkongensis]|uniref:AAA family ATPase n=1 Tax=Anaerospora hongkongensis TaxID=244830 RepID=UPI002FDB5A5A
MNKFHICEVHIENFRGYKKGNFTFFKNTENKKGLILLGGPNGFGKTSLIDAIEWCLSGNVRRLENEFRTRTKGDNENQLLHKGIFKHLSGSGDTMVRINARYKGEPVIIERIFKGKHEKEVFEGKSELRVEASFKIKGDVETLICEISGSFYDRYICSYEKNIQMYQKGREDIYNMFASFFGSNPKIEKIIENLEGNGLKGNKKVKGIIEELEEKLTQAQREEKELEKQVADRKTTLDSQELRYKEFTGYIDDIERYPQPLLFTAEKSPLAIEKIEPETAKLKLIYHQKNLLQAILNIPVYEAIEAYTNSLGAEIVLKNFRRDLLELFRKKAKQVTLAQQTTISDILAWKIRLETSSRVLKGINNARQLIRYVLALINQPVFKESDLDLLPLREKVYELQKQKNALDHQSSIMSAFDSATPVVNALRALVDHVSGFHTYREYGNKECPLCGNSETFVTSEIASKAKIMLGDADKKRAEAEMQTREIEQKHKEIYNEVYSVTRNYLEKIVKTLDLKKDQIEDIEGIRLAAIKHGFNFEEINEECLVGREAQLIEQLNSSMINRLLSEDEVLAYLEEPDSTLRGIRSQINNSDNATRSEFTQWTFEVKKQVLEKLVEEYRSQIQQVEFLTDLSQEGYDSIQTRVSILETMEKVSRDTEIFKDAKLAYEASVQMYEQAKGRKTKLNEQVAELKLILNTTKELKSVRERKMTEQIISPVTKFYRRINRHTNFTDICLNRTGTVAQKSELIVTDQNGNDCLISNVLSTGQLSTLAISIFFATALKHESSPFRCYFMDDPIQSMDDLNILSFVDLLRNETVINSSEDGCSFDQIFISTCDEDLENLILHKVKGFGANYCNLHFTGYGKYIDSDDRNSRLSGIIIEDEQ